MTNDGYCNQPRLSVSGKPAERESCKICHKFIYFHQPILLCKSCCKVFHGTCLKLSNDQVFIYQQISWHCINCFDNNKHMISCESCFKEFDFQNDKFSLCQQCRKPTHYECRIDSVCLSCKPFHFSQPNMRSRSNFENIEADNFFNNLPIFSPFEFYERNIVDFIPDADYLSDAMNQCSMILNSCSYLKTDECKKHDQQIFKASLVGLNIDGVRTNFDQFKIIHNELNSTSNNVLGYFISETNVTDSESQTFYLD